ncbi:MAG: cytochrome oxidase putative small subunit CydP [Gammaproteobacteria bacterium]
MSFGSGLYPLVQKLKFPRPDTFSLEISIALMVKFCLLAVLWWVFFAGNKLHVDDAIVADKIFDANKTVSLSNTSQERP